MSKSILMLLVTLCLVNASLAHRLPRALDSAIKTAGNAASSGESSEEFTEKDLEELKTELAKQLPEEDVKRIGDIFAKFTDGTPAEKQLEGIFELLGLLVEGSLAQSKLKNANQITTEAVDDTATASKPVDLTGNSV